MLPIAWQLEGHFSCWKPLSSIARGGKYSVY